MRVRERRQWPAKYLAAVRFPAIQRVCLVKRHVRYVNVPVCAALVQDTLYQASILVPQKNIRRPVDSLQSISGPSEGTSAHCMEVCTALPSPC
jgi:hypothetical protein